MAGDLHNGRLRLAYLTGEESRLSVSLDCGGESRGPRDLPARNNTGPGPGAAICRHPPRGQRGRLASRGHLWTRGAPWHEALRYRAARKSLPPACQARADSSGGSKEASEEPWPRQRLAGRTALLAVAPCNYSDRLFY